MLKIDIKKNQMIVINTIFDDEPILDEEFLNDSNFFDDFFTNNDGNDNDIRIFCLFEAGFEDLNDIEKFVFCVLMRAHVKKWSDMIYELKFNIIPQFAHIIGLNNFFYIFLAYNFINKYIYLIV